MGRICATRFTLRSAAVNFGSSMNCVWRARRVRPVSWWGEGHCPRAVAFVGQGIAIGVIADGRAADRHWRMRTARTQSLTRRRRAVAIRIHPLFFDAEGLGCLPSGERAIGVARAMGSALSNHPFVPKPDNAILPVAREVSKTRGRGDPAKVSDGSTQRRLAAIMVIDVVGYSCLMETDEAGTLAALRVRRKGIVEPQVRENAGRIVKFMGDGVLVEFVSAVSALRCALGLQARMAEANERLPDAKPIILRIGMNIGEIAGEGSDIAVEDRLLARLGLPACDGDIDIGRADFHGEDPAAIRLARHDLRSGARRVRSRDLPAPHAGASGCQKHQAVSASGGRAAHPS